MTNTKVTPNTTLYSAGMATGTAAGGEAGARMDVLVTLAAQVIDGTMPRPYVNGYLAGLPSHLGPSMAAALGKRIRKLKADHDAKPVPSAETTSYTLGRDDAAEWITMGDHTDGALESTAAFMDTLTGQPGNGDYPRGYADQVKEELARRAQADREHSEFLRSRGFIAGEDL